LIGGVILEIIKYIGAAFSTWFVGFFPYFEIYIAVPAGFAAGLNWFDAFFWASLGNWMVIPFVDICYEWLMRFKFMNKIAEKSLNGKWQDRIEKYGSWFILLLTPLAGVWTIAVIAKVLKFNRAKLLIYSAISVWVTGLIIAILIINGITLVS
jgi:uncharacterized membrane protein